MSQREQILGLLVMHPRGVCAWEFLRRGWPRYAARIHDIKANGHRVVTEECDLHAHPRRVVKYRLIRKL